MRCGRRCAAGRVRDRADKWGPGSHGQERAGPHRGLPPAERPPPPQHRHRAGDPSAHEAAELRGGEEGSAERRARQGPHDADRVPWSGCRPGARRLRRHERLADVHVESEALFLSASSIAAGRPHARSTRSSSRSAASTTWRSLTANAGSAPWRPHDLRHTFAYRLSEPQGEPVSAGRLRRRPIRGDEAGPARPVLRDDVIAGRPRVQSMQD
jgi:hypothetical protein